MNILNTQNLIVRAQNYIDASRDLQGLAERTTPPELECAILALLAAGHDNVEIINAMRQLGEEHCDDARTALQAANENDATRPWMNWNLKKAS